MCGILGGWYLNFDKKDVSRIEEAMNLLKNRGPNDQSYEHFSNLNGNIILGHTRLSIIDLSKGGNQPMHSSNGRYSIIFNGEIYNYKELRQKLMTLGYSFSTESDTEVLLNAWTHWKEACLQQLIGMFAFVVYDKKLNLLTCVRDSFGIKPFFYSLNQNQFVFASTIQALIKMRDTRPKANIQRSYDYLVYADYDSQEQSFIDGVKHLLPGQLVTYNLNTNSLSKPKKWWEFSINPQYAMLNFKDASEAVRELFLQNVALHLRSDVPLGAALSGGIDSSAIVCAMRHIEPDLPIHTFSFTANQKDISEEKWVDIINGYINAIPHKVYATEQDLAQDLDDMIDAQGEPFGSTSIYAQYKVFKLAKENNIIVTLDGQGADELLAGYQGYPTQRILSLIEHKKLLHCLKFINHWQKWPNRSYIKGILHLSRALMPDQISSLTYFLKNNGAIPAWINKELIHSANTITNPPLYEKEPEFKGKRVIEMLHYALTQKGLPELLRHGDRNSMRFSIESRVPFLTLPLANLLLSLPEHYLISEQGETKSVFREAMRGIVPDSILNRRDKIGFATPEKDWLFKIAPVVREWLLESQGIELLKSDKLLKEFDNIIAGKKPFSWQLWRWINFTRWHNKMIQGS
ncbi:MAG: asparagine synthase (glutamine-hydrolyzing) [Legionella sp.]|nr:MAG: asparagine synthase (glutamine-hydrolyzing) [Legionella sp.]PJD97388.1 MAG: asparagine synthase (glutamine-hydrolyzing) [Legionella sp.]